MIAHLQLSGMTGPSGTRYVRVSHEGASACIPFIRLGVDRPGSKTALISQGINLLSDSDWRKFLEKASDLREFPRGSVIEKVGWNGGTFALPDGTIISPGKGDGAQLAIDVHSSKCSTRGSFRKWQAKVAARLVDQHLATFLLMTAFMPPLLNLSDRFGNFGFEIVGPKGTGKSTIQYLVSSVLGGVGQNSLGHYWVTLDTTYNALDDTMALHSDLPIIMDEANLLAADASPKERAAIYKALAFKLGSGSVKVRYGSRAEADHRLGFIISSNEPLAELLGQSTEGARAAADRLITLQIDASRPFGVFDTLSNEFRSSSELAQKLIGAAQRHHGWAIREFLKPLVSERAADEAKLRRKISRHVRSFRKEAGVSVNDGSAVRIAEAFGLVYAAGRLAQRYGVLPRVLNVHAAALNCYRLHSAHSDNATPFASRLLELLTDERVKTLEKGAKPADAIAHIKIRKGEKELLVPPENIDKLFPDWRHIKSSTDVRRHQQRDGAHFGPKRSFSGKRKCRVFCFRIPPQEPD